MLSAVRSVLAVPWPWAFLFRNKAKGIPLLLLVALSVLVITTVSAITDSIMMSVYRSSVQPYEHASAIVSSGISIPLHIVRNLENSDEVEGMVPFLDSSVRVTGMMGSESRRVLAVPTAELENVMTRFHVRIDGGRLPIRGEPEIAIHESIARSKGVHVGDVIGREVDSDDYLWGAFVVTGTLRGDIPMCVSSLEYFKKQWIFDAGDSSYAYLVFPVPGRLASLNRTLGDKLGGEATAITLDSVMPAYRSEFANTRMVLWAVDLLVIVIVSIAMGLVNTVHYLTRLREFGLLASIGLTPAGLVIRTITEVLGLGLAGFGAGVALARIALWLLSVWLFEPRGIDMNYLKWKSIVFAIPVPLLVSVFSTITVWVNILRLDPVSIMEGRD